MDSKKIRELSGEKFKDWYLNYKQSAWDKDNIHVVGLRNGTFTKYLWYDEQEDKVLSNVVDARYTVDSRGLNDTDDIFLTSYVINGKIRVFVGLMNIPLGIVYPVGYDVCKKEYVVFPLNQSELIDDKLMEEELEKEDPSIGMTTKDFLVGMSYNNYYTTLRVLAGIKLGDSNEIGYYVRGELIRQNQARIIEVGTALEKRSGTK